MRHARLILLSAIVLLAAILLLVWSLRDVSLSEVWTALSSLQAWQLAAILVVNGGLILLFASRWWLILVRQGHRIPYFEVARYRLAAFSISYFTPGQHFGGEPLQVFFLHKNHHVASGAAVASVALDKAIELFTNFTVLGIGIEVLASSGLFNSSPLIPTLLFSILLLALPAGYLFVLVGGSRPLSQLLRKSKKPFWRTIVSGEAQLAVLTKREPNLLLIGLGAAALVWAGLFFEYWLLLFFLGIGVNGFQLLAIVIAGRIALLAPTPGAIGALEASQVLVMQALGFNPAYGLALGLLIRARDIFFGTIGLVLGGAAGFSAYRRSLR